MKDIDNIFDDKNLKKKIRRLKIRQTMKIVIIVILTIAILKPINYKKSLELGLKTFKERSDSIELSIKNGYVSKASHFIEFLGGQTFMTVSKTVLGKPVVLNDLIYEFNYFGNGNSYDMASGGGPGTTIGGWNINYYQNGYRRLDFFHPDLNYKEYRNDLDYLDEIGDKKILEVALSFDKPYKIGDIFKLQNSLKDVNITFLWLNEFTKEKMEEYKYEIENYDAKACSVDEVFAVGLEVYGAKNYDFRSYNEGYEELMSKLKETDHAYYNQLYSEIEERGFTKVEDAEVLGVVVQGTKENMEVIKDLDFIKASVIGVITEK